MRMAECRGIQKGQPIQEMVQEEKMVRECESLNENV
jgi:hypothetical protein